MMHNFDMMNVYCSIENCITVCHQSSQTQHVAAARCILHTFVIHINRFYINRSPALSDINRSCFLLLNVYLSPRPVVAHRDGIFRNGLVIGGSCMLEVPPVLVRARC